MRLTLRIVNDDDATAPFLLDPPGGVIGRRADCAIHLPCESVSRAHAELWHDGQRWWIRHRSARSPTLLDDAPVAPVGAEQPLAEQGRLRIGRVQLSYWQAPSPAFLHVAPTVLLPGRLPMLVLPATVISQLSPVRADPDAQAGGTLRTVVRSAEGVPATQIRAGAARSNPADTNRIVAASAARPADAAELRAKAAALLEPFGRSLDQIGEALRLGDAAQARALVRAACFALADLRDLFAP
jgi:hypothetical protein